MINQFYKKSRLRLGFSKPMLSVTTAIAFVLASMISVASFAQTVSVKGKVTDGDNFGLPGVTVQVKGTSNGVATDLDGNYTINDVPSNGTLLFSFVGMNSQEIAVGGQSVINVNLEEDSQSL